MSLRLFPRIPTLALFIAAIATPHLPGQTPIEKKSSWQPASSARIVAAFDGWLIESGVETSKSSMVRSYLTTNRPESGVVVDYIAQGLQIGDDDVARFLEYLATADSDDPAQTSILLDNEAYHKFVKSHVRLLYARWLARNELFDESLGQLDKLAVDEVLDPATLLYYRGLMEHQLLKPKACIKTLKRLLENSESLPRRYVVLSELMIADMKRLEEDSLDEIARMMGDIRRRTELNRSGTRVRKQEQDVIGKLDKLIKRLEEQQQQMQMAQSQGNAQPSSPADREQRLAGQGSGTVKSKRQNDGGQWGNLDPVERDAALAEMSKDLPPHYRSVIEDYFRKLAEQNEKRQ